MSYFEAKEMSTASVGSYLAAHYTSTGSDFGGKNIINYTVTYNGVAGSCLVVAQTG